ncbi:MAG: LamG-like jellyroll fold domain-containing protein, partial [Saprospiraceae bacterium]
ICLPVLVEGNNHVVTNGRNGVPTQGSVLAPQIPWMILRDPPGDESFATFETSKERCRSYSWSNVVEGSTEVGGAVKLGVKGTVGGGFIVETSTEFEAYVEASASMETGIKRTDQNETEICFKSTTGFSTSDNDNVVGADGDVFIGTGREYAYGTYVDIKYDLNACKLDVTGELRFAPDGVETEFFWTEGKIRSEIERLQDVIAAVGSGATEQEQLDKLRNETQLSIWEQALSINESIKANQQPVLVEPLSFNGGVKRTGSTVATYSTASTIEFDIFVQGEIGVEAKIEAGGSGVTGYSKVRLGTNFGESSSTNTEGSEAFSYCISDNEGDKINVDVYRDFIFGGVYYELRETSETSCPYEGGYQLDQPKLSATVSGSDTENIILHAPPGTTVRIPLNICNESIYARSYDIRMDASTNTNGAVVKLGGDDLNGANPVNYSIGANTCFTNNANKPMLAIEQASGTNPPFQYENITLTLYSCDEDQTSTFSFSIYFDDLDGDGIPDDTDSDGLLDVIDSCPDLPTQGLNFDGDNDYVELPTSIFNPQQGTIEYWFKTDNLNTIQIPLYIGNRESENGFSTSSRALEFHTAIRDKKIEFLYQKGIQSQRAGLKGKTLLESDRWYHFAVTYDLNGETIIYLDGIEERRVSSSSIEDEIIPATFARLGRPGADTYYFNGTMDELRIWDVVRTAAQINANLQKELTGTENNLVALYNVNEGVVDGNNTSITEIVDKTENEYNGELQGLALTGSTSNWTFGAPMEQVQPCATVLPLDFLSFTGTPLATGNQLTWLVANEYDTQIHLVETSSDGKYFIEIGKLNASNNRYYRWLHEQPARRAYYRIRTIDTDGSETYSNTILIECETPKVLAIQDLFPVPAQDELHINFALPTTAQIQIEILNLVGQRMTRAQQSLAAGNHQLTLPTNELVSGTYFLRLIQTDGSYVLRKFIIQR